MRTCTPLRAIHLSDSATDRRQFDQHYINRLRNGCALTTSHFADHFTRRLNAVVRRYVRQADLVDDIRQETLLRVLQIVSREGFLTACFEAFVLRTARLVAYEMLRAELRYCGSAETVAEPQDGGPSPEAAAIEQASAKKTEETLASIDGRDGRILTMIVQEDADRSEICRRFGLTEAYLRVVIHRARVRFQQKALQAEGAGLGRAA